MAPFLFYNYLLFGPVLFLFQDKPCASYSAYINTRIIGHILPQPAYEDVHASSKELIILSPDFSKNIFPGKDLVFVYNEIAQQLGLFQCEFFLLLAADQFECIEF